jgi:hypothetical protein
MPMQSILRASFENKWIRQDAGQADCKRWDSGPWLWQWHRPRGAGAGVAWPLIRFCLVYFRPMTPSSHGMSPANDKRDKNLPKTVSSPASPMLKSQYVYKSMYMDRAIRFTALFEKKTSVSVHEIFSTIGDCTEEITWRKTGSESATRYIQHAS